MEIMLRRPSCLAILLHWLVSFVSCSFMAIGPPGAPAALHMNSSVELDLHIKSLTLIENLVRWSNSSQYTNSSQHTNSSLSDDSAKADPYWFLADSSSFRHEASKQLSIRQILILNALKHSNHMQVLDTKRFAMSRIMEQLAMVKLMTGQPS